MKVEHREDGIHVWLRQSWINDAMMCQERGRRDVMDPTWKMQGDSACIGTAMHAGCEATLLGWLDRGSDPMEAIEKEWEEMNSRPMRLTLGMTPSEMLAEAKRLYRMWERDIYPDINVDQAKGNFVVAVEWNFDVEWYTFEYRGTTVHVHLSGTADLLQTLRIWDWKSSGRKYSQKEKQAEAIQPIVYSIAAVKSGYLAYPVEFRYGVMMRGKDETQIVPIRRTHNHEVWLSKIVEPLIRQMLAVGWDDPWPMNDTHNLCSDKWCPWWGGCKGHALSNTDLELFAA